MQTSPRSKLSSTVIGALTSIIMALTGLVAVSPSAQAADSDAIEIVWEMVGTATPSIRLENYSGIKLEWTRTRAGVATSYTVAPANNSFVIPTAVPPATQDLRPLTEFAPSTSAAPNGIGSALAVGDILKLRILPAVVGQPASVQRIIVTFGYTSTSQKLGSVNLKEVVSLGNLGLTSLNRSFEEAPNFTMTANLPKSVTSLEGAFTYSAVTVPGVGKWDTSNVTSMRSIFDGCQNFNENISAWNTSNVTDMYMAFQSTRVFNQNLSSWNTSKVTTMHRMFFQARVFNQDISAWNTSKVTDMEMMFQLASAFNQDISVWNTSKVTSMFQMFYTATVFNQSLGAWDVSQVEKIETGKNVGLDYMFGSTSFSASNYAATLTGWASRPVKSNVEFHVDYPTSTLIADSCARVFLTNAPRSWKFYDGWNNADGSDKAAVDAKRSTCSSGTAPFWTPVDTTILRSPFTPVPAITSPSGGTVYYTVDPTSTSDCTLVSSNTPQITYSTAGTCKVIATSETTANKYPASAPTITFNVTPLPDATLTWNLDAAQLSPATAVSPYLMPTSPQTNGGALTYVVVSPGTSGCTVNAITGAITFTGAGNCKVRVTTAETAGYAAKSLDVIFQLPAPTVPSQPNTDANTSPISSQGPLPSSTSIVNNKPRIKIVASVQFDGNSKNNKKLTKARAIAVRKYLKSIGITDASYSVSSTVMVGPLSNARAAFITVTWPDDKSKKKMNVSAYFDPYSSKVTTSSKKSLRALQKKVNSQK